MTFEEKTLESEIIYKGKVFTVRRDKITIANGGTAYRDLIFHNGAVAIAALTRDKKLLMIRQFRKAAEEVLWEIPAGKVEPGETDWLEAAKRELREETGYEAENWRHFSKFYGCIGYDNEQVELFFADATIKGETDFEEEEAIELYEMDPAELVRMVYSGEIKDAKTIIAVLAVARELGI